MYAVIGFMGDSGAATVGLGVASVLTGFLLMALAVIIDKLSQIEQHLWRARKTD